MGSLLSVATYFLLLYYYIMQNEISELSRWITITNNYLPYDISLTLQHQEEVWLKASSLTETKYPCRKEIFVGNDGIIQTTLKLIDYMEDNWTCYQEINISNGDVTLECTFKNEQLSLNLFVKLNILPSIKTIFIDVYRPTVILNRSSFDLLYQKPDQSKVFTLAKESVPISMEYVATHIKIRIDDDDNWLKDFIDVPLGQGNITWIPFFKKQDAHALRLEYLHFDMNWSSSYYTIVCIDDGPGDNHFSDAEWNSIVSLIHTEMNPWETAQAFYPIPFESPF